MEHDEPGYIRFSYSWNSRDQSVISVPRALQVHEDPVFLASLALKR